jgi:hypothetical protein
MTSTNKIPLPSFLKLLTSNNVSTPKAMAVAGKMSLSFPVSSHNLHLSLTAVSYRYKDFNTPAMLSQLTDVKMKAAGIDDKDLRKSVLSAFRKAGYKASPSTASPSHTSASNADLSSSAGGNADPGPSTVQILVSPQTTTKLIL